MNAPGRVREFRVLGPVEVQTDADGPAPALSPKHRTLLAVLLVHANQVVSVDQLIDYLWGERPPTYAVNLLRGYVSDLRKTLGLGRSTDAAESALVTRSPGYLLAVPAGRLDLRVFEDGVERGRLALAGGDAQRAAETLREALGLWRGSALSDVDSDALRQREGGRLEELWLAALEDRIEADLTLGEHHGLIPELAALVGEHPMRERLRGQLMLALYRAGRQAEALAEYRKAREALVEELGIEPGPALQRLERAILAADPALDLPAPTDQAPTSVAATRPAQLPADVATFTGREGHLSQLDALLGDEGPPPSAVVISAIAGTAGVGKTALATRWGHQVRERFPDGQLCVNLRGYAQSVPLRPVEALAQFLRALGVPAEQVPDDVDEAASLYRSRLADRRLLIILDNARSAEQVRPLLPGAGSSVVLVTSRDQLTGLVARDGAERINLDVLSADEAGGLLARLLGADRVLAEPAATGELARLCAYLPLALRIAAAKLADDPATSTADYVARLRSADRLSALTVEGDEEAGTRAAFDLSYAALPAQTRRLFRLLGLVPGPDVTAEAAAALADATMADAAHQLDRLARAHLLEPQANGRYSFHDLLRLYATELAHHEDAEPDRRAATTRLLDHFLHTADAAAKTLYPARLRLPIEPTDTRALGAVEGDPEQASAWLESERPNLIAAVSHAAEHGPRRTAWLLADTLRGYLWLNVDAIDWLAAAGAGLVAAQAEGDLQGQAAAHISLGDLRWAQSRVQRALDHFTQALDLARQVGWVEGQAACLGAHGAICRSLGRLEESAQHNLEGLALQRRSGNLRGQPVSLSNLGSVYWELGRLRDAADCYTQGLELSRQIGSRTGEAINLCNLAEASHALGHLDRALDLLSQAEALRREIGNRRAEPEDLRIRAAVHSDKGQQVQAVEVGETALSIARDLGRRAIEAEALNTLGVIHQRLGNVQQATDYHQQSLQLARNTDSRWQEALALIGLVTAEERDRALEHAKQALAVTRESGYRVLEGQALTALASVFVRGHRHADAVRTAEEALALHRETRHRLGEARTLVVLGHALRTEREGAARTLGSRRSTC